MLSQPQPQCPQHPWHTVSVNLYYRVRRHKRKCRTNCLSIEIPVLFPSNMEFWNSSDDMMSDQQIGLVSAMAEVEVDNILSRDGENVKQFPFLSLPLEIRLAIYGYLLPSRNHTIVTQYPHNGYYYSKPPSHTSQTLYPAWSASPHQPPSHKTSGTQTLTTYKLLNANFRSDFPNPSICPEIFRTCSQILYEAEPMLYAGAMFDFGVYIDAVVPFLKDRSAAARRAIRSMKLAREIPQFVSEIEDTGDGRQTLRTGAADPLWSLTCEYMAKECKDLRVVDLTVWAESGSMVELPIESAEMQESESEHDHAVSASEKDDISQVDNHMWREWEWTRALLMTPSLRHVKVTWWGFAMDKVGQGRFDSWLGRRMVADKLVRDRMVWEGCVIEGVCVLPGDWQASNMIEG
jgi:hypothetical protein